MLELFQEFLELFLYEFFQKFFSEIVWSAFKHCLKKSCNSRRIVSNNHLGNPPSIALRYSQEFLTGFFFQKNNQKEIQKKKLPIMAKDRLHKFCRRIASSIPPGISLRPLPWFPKDFVQSHTKFPFNREF